MFVFEWPLWASVAILATAGFAHGIFGLGFAMIATPLLALFLDYRVAVLMVAVPSLLMASSWLAVHRRQLRLCRIPSSLLPAIAVGATLGAALQAGLPERVSLLLLASLLATSVLTTWALARWQPPETASREKAGAVFGGLAGMTESALNVGAPFALLYGAFARLNRIEQLVVLNLCFALAKAIQVGLISVTSVPHVGGMAMVLGTAASGAAYYLGNGLANRFSEARFRALLRCFLFVMIGALIARAAWL
ncbi:sulfite exporter TauE/SafE family protein [Variovorax sp. KK3]|uniref:sulfite exporter TauE/SafE family protein n=1 Tax=Variovorax sp. KK3 TaxID=1855728 RepID=UPI00097C202A|nr:sulfite exporter TauE/SafE family protein [Variovorax sp. KK3]